MKILGIHDGHNSSAALLIDGRLIAAVSEERFKRTKNWFGFPEEAIKSVLKIGGCRINDIDIIALAGKHMPYPKTREQLLEEYEKTGSIKTSLKRFLKSTVIKTIYNERRKEERTRQVESLGVPRGKITFVEHHSCHQATAYYGMGDYDKKYLVITNDGAGDGLCATVGIGEQGKITRLAEVQEADSIGNIYAMVTFLMGMIPLEHEYKLMGMAPYASQEGSKKVFDIFSGLFYFLEGEPLIWKRTKVCPETYYSYDFLDKSLKLCRFDHICGGLQNFTESMLTTWIRNCIKAKRIRRVVASGGVFMNVKANLAILKMPEVESLYVFPSCGDETNAIGACYYAYAQSSLDAYKTLEPLRDLYLGNEYDESAIARCLEGIKEDKIDIREPIDLNLEVARLLADGKIVARFSGRAEFGARALGNRSIIANPKDLRVVKKLNDAIKSRDFWMPFAPSILSLQMLRYVINPKSVPAPYMILSFDTTENRGDIQAAIHPYDFTARPQEVYELQNRDYFDLISKFQRLTGIGAVLNTSFNLHGYPIVETPQDAVDVFLRSRLDALAIGRFLLSK